MGMSPLDAVIFLVLIVTIIVLDRSSRQTQRHVPLREGQRVRSLAALWLEPLLEVVLVVVVLRDELSEGGAHWAAAAVGTVAGVVLGIRRARDVFVRSEPRYQSVIVRETRAETIALVAILAVDIGSQILSQSNVWLSLFVTTALSFLVINSCTMTIDVTRRYRRDRAASLNG